MHQRWRNGRAPRLTPRRRATQVIAPGDIGALPAGSWVNSLTLRLRAEITAREAINKSFGFWFPVEGNQGFGA